MSPSSPDHTGGLTIRLTQPEQDLLAWLAAQAGLTVEQLLVGFVGDLADSTNTGGSDEREYAFAWYKRRFATDYIDATTAPAWRASFPEDAAGGADVDALRATIDDLVAQAEQLASVVDYDAAGYAALGVALDALDAAVEPGLVRGRVLRFPVADRHAIYVVDTVRGDQVRCVWIPGFDSRTAEAVDAEGWCARATALTRLARQEGRA